MERQNRGLCERGSIYMGSCTSKPGSPGSTRTKRKGGDHQPTVLDKYSFSAVNPAFADFEGLHGRSPEEEEAAARLRQLAQQSFLVTPSNELPESDPDQSFDVDLTSLACGREIEEIEELPGPAVDVQQEASNNNNALKRTGSYRGRNHYNHHRHKVRLTEEKLVMSSSCMPSYSLGVVVTPECRIKNRF